MEKRGRVIEELIQTEKDYLTSLSLIMESFLGPNAEKVCINLKVSIEHVNVSLI